MKSSITCILTLAALLVTGCKKDFLNNPPIDQVTSDNFYKTDEEVIAGTAALYNIVWFDYNDKAFLAFGEARGGNLSSNDRTAYIQFSVSSTDQNTLLAGYKSFFKIVAQSNLTMYNIEHASGSASEAVKKQAYAECRFMRAMAYYYLVSNWGAVPIMYNTLTQLGNVTHRNKIEDVWRFIIRDLRYAAENLPATPAYGQKGRISKYTAEGELAKMYLTRSGYGQSGTRVQSDLDSAKIYAGDVCNNSGLKLLDNYGDLFRSATNNASAVNDETLFALLWMGISTPWGVNNSFQAYMAFSTDITQTGDGWGAVQGGSADLVKYYVNNPDDSIRRKETLMFQSDYYADLNKKNGGTTITQTTISNLKKYVIGSPDDNNKKGGFMAAYINTYMLRLAEVYLIYADAILGNNSTTSDGTALKYYNAVRKRAGMPEKTAITFGDIFQEKRVELAFEGNAWYDILRWWYFNPEGAKSYVLGQDKANYTLTYNTGSSHPRRWTLSSTPQYFGFTSSTVYLPLPEAELGSTPTLSQDPVAFDFSQLP